MVSPDRAMFDVRSCEDGPHLRSRTAAHAARHHRHTTWC